MVRIVVASLALLLSACAGNVPQPIVEAPPGNPAVAEVRVEPDRFVGTQVRWGGTIALVDNRKDETLLQLVARDLDRSGRPQTTDRSEGRFIARFDRFIDPAVFSQGRQVTVTGRISGTLELPVGNFPYRFPVVEVDTHYLWQPVEPRERNYYPYDPFWYDPWMYPYRPLRPWPYW
jgi:outer membrane lipoprotein